MVGKDNWSPQKVYFDLTQTLKHPPPPHHPKKKNQKTRKKRQAKQRRGKLPNTV